MITYIKAVLILSINRNGKVMVEKKNENKNKPITKIKQATHRSSYSFIQTHNSCILNGKHFLSPSPFPPQSWGGSQGVSP